MEIFARKWMRTAARLGRPVLLLVLLVASTGSPAQNSDSRRLTFYAPGTSYRVDVVDRNGHEYADLLAILEPLQAYVEVKRREAVVKLGLAQAEFHAGRTQVQMRGGRVDLPTPFLVENGRGLVPVAGLTPLLSRLTGMRIESHDTVRRIFIGVEHTTLVSSDVKPGDAPALVLRFSAPVNPAIHSEPGRVRLTFHREPLVGGGTKSFLTDPIRSLSYSDQSGLAELVVATGAPLQASFSDGNRTITLTAPAGSATAQSPATPPAQPQVTPAPGTSPAGTAEVKAQPAPGTPRPEAPTTPAYTVIIDPAHGAQDLGVGYKPEVAEKEITLALAQRLRQELQQRGIHAVLLRSGDEALSADERAEMANALRPQLYVALHSGTGMIAARVFTATPPSRVANVRFRPWRSANAAHAAASDTFAATTAEQLLARDLPTMRLTAPLPPLGSIAAPAIAVEVSPAGGDVESLRTASFQARIASAVADAVVAYRQRTEAP